MKTTTTLTAVLRKLQIAGLAMAALAIGGPAASQESKFPSRPVKLMIASAPGGATDVISRMLAEKLSAAWGQPVLVEQRVGANGMIAAAALSKAAPDGHLAYVSISSIVQNVLLRPDPGYRLEDLEPVSMIATIPIAMAVGTTTGIDSVADLVALARSKPEQVSYGTTGAGSGSHIVVAALSRAADVKMTHVPYKGETSSFADVVSGQLTVGLGSAGFYATQAASGKVKLLAITGPARLPRVPDVPTLAEAGYPGANLPGWFGVFLPPKTPKPIVERFSQTLREAIAQPDIQARLLEVGFLPAGDSSEEFAQYIQLQKDTWAKVIKENNISLD